MLHIQFRPNYFSTSFDLSFFDQTFSTWLYVADKCLAPFAEFQCSLCQKKIRQNVPCFRQSGIRHKGHIPQKVCFCRCRQLPCPLCRISMPTLPKKKFGKMSHAFGKVGIEIRQSGQKSFLLTLYEQLEPRKLFVTSEKMATS